MTTEVINNNLKISIDPTFTDINKLFVLAYQTADDRQSFSQIYLPNVMVKDYNVIIDKLAFFDLPIKTEEKAYEKIIDISRNNEYITQVIRRNQVYFSSPNVSTETTVIVKD